MRDMENVVPLIAERFPEIRDKILRLRFRDALLDELCRDYDEVMHSLEAVKGDSGKAGAEKVELHKTDEGSPNTSNREMLEQIATNLENELLRRFAVINRSKGRGGSV
jgi:hypothetical protein